MFRDTDKNTLLISFCQCKKNMEFHVKCNLLRWKTAIIDSHMSFPLEFHDFYWNSHQDVYARQQWSGLSRKDNVGKNFSCREERNHILFNQIILLRRDRGDGFDFFSRYMSTDASWLVTLKWHSQLRPSNESLDKTKNWKGLIRNFDNSASTFFFVKFIEDCFFEKLVLLHFSVMNFESFYLFGSCCLSVWHIWIGSSINYVF